ncbi:hypothetical protein BGY98DRAFT_1025581 [Russula aff. rugulosa BPL654]|nr:hypothetical protein BGY98DRAFT_1025581 [Russula aff. rugulosa BPL654]
MRSLLIITFTRTVPIHCGLSIVPDSLPETRRESTVSHRGGFFDNDYHACQFTAKVLKADICLVLQAERFGRVRLTVLSSCNRT